MKKFLVLSFSLILVQFSIAQDSVYYASAFNSSGDSLKGLLHNIIRNHTEFPYSSSGTDTWDILKETDRDTANPANVILIYSNRSVDAAQEFNNGNGWNREHVWPRSRGDFSTSAGVGTDVHHLRPCDIQVNSTRENRNFDDCSNCVDVIDGGFNTGSKTDASAYTFQPPANVKGDVARMIFYMAVRYEGTGGELDLELTNTLQTNTAKLPVHARLSTLLDWHRQDSVDDFERNRNLVIYSYQGNKNPFIDYPELAEYLWGDSLNAVWKAPVIVNPTGIRKEISTKAQIYPNPANEEIYVKGKSILNIELFDLAGKRTEIPVSNLSDQRVINTSTLKAGVYILEIETSFGRLKEKIIIEH